MAPQVMNVLVSDLGGNLQTAPGIPEGVRGDPAEGTHQENLQSGLMRFRPTDERFEH